MKKVKWLLVMVLVLSVFVSCEVAYSSNLNALMKWADQYASTYYKIFNMYKGKTNAELINDKDAITQMQKEQQELAEESYPYNTAQTMREVARENVYSNGKYVYYYVFVPVPEDDKDIAETKAEVKGDQYYVIGIVTIETNSNDPGNTPNEQLKILNVSKKVYISSQLPGQQ